MTENNSVNRSIFDFFISYKQRDSSSFVEALTSELRLRKYDIWLDSREMMPGDSILKSIEDGLTSSIDAIVVLSANYFDGWSEQERRSIYSLMVSKKTRMIPIWYKINYDEVLRAAPMLADIVGIPVSLHDETAIKKVCDKIAESFKPEQRRSRLFELFFRCVAKHFPEDNEIAVFLAVFDNNITALEQALSKGADPNITDSALWNRYNKSALECCFPEWRKLFLYLSQTGQIGKHD
jgi:TIR domain